MGRRKDEAQFGLSRTRDMVLPNMNSLAGGVTKAVAAA